MLVLFVQMMEEEAGTLKQSLQGMLSNIKSDDESLMFFREKVRLRRCQHLPTRQPCSTDAQQLHASSALLQLKPPSHSCWLLRLPSS